ncbi:MAG: hypothetical protein Q7R41_16540, partial [Phycisphaerales bacterium]|nr:hypothetical protein [Phycisphaerales bacterium]
IAPVDRRLLTATAAASGILLSALILGRSAGVSSPLLPVISLVLGAIGFTAIAWRGALADAEKSGLVALLRP